MTYSKLALAVPPDAANARMNAFFKDLGELREKHGLPDVFVIVRQNIETHNGGEAPGLCSIHYGDQSQILQMVSYALGFATGEHQKFVLEARSQGMKTGADIAMKSAKKLHDSLFDE